MVSETGGAEESSKERRRVCEDPGNTLRKHVSGVVASAILLANNDNIYCSRVGRHSSMTQLAHMFRVKRVSHAQVGKPRGTE